MRIVTFGEIMLRLSPPGCERLFQSDRMQAVFGGAEANVAVSLAQLGQDAVYVTSLPDNAVGQAALNSVRSFGVDTSHIVRASGRMGIYYLEKGASQRGSMCIYDRAGSVFSRSQPQDYDWNAIFNGAQWFHFSGITPALSDTLADICKQACVQAKKRGITVSCDLNYRSKLWSAEKARRVLTELYKNVDVCIANEWQAKELFEIKEPGDSGSGKPDIGMCERAAMRLCEKYGFKNTVFSLRTTFTADDNAVGGIITDGHSCFASRDYKVHIVDRVGSGDAFAAGAIYALSSGMDMQSVVNFAAAMNAFKHSVEGDFCRVSVSEIEKLAGGDDGRIGR